MLKSKADQKEAMLKPAIKLLANNINKVLMTKVNKPKVKIFIGKVKNSKMGLIKVFRIPKTTTNTIAVQKVGICTPGTK